MLLVVPAVAGLDAGRFHWSTLGAAFVIRGVVLYVAASTIVYWAMAVNPYFEGTARIQKGRGRRVVAAEPYRMVRHPGYVGIILGDLALPLVIGPVFAPIPAGVAILLMVILRTFLEDGTLQEELHGYREYAKRVRYRLVPGVW